VQGELGEALRIVSRYDDALAALDRSLELDPGRTWTRASRAATLYGLERYDEAIHELDEVVKGDPEYAFAIGTRGEVKSMLADWDPSIADLTRATELDPKSDWFFGLTGWSLENAGKPESALAAYDEALVHAPDSALWRRGRADSLRALGRPDAEDEYRRVVDDWESREEEQRADVLFVLGWCHYNLGQYEQAVRYYTDDLAVDPESVSSQFDLALVLATSGRGTLALTEYERGIEMADKKPPRRRLALLEIALRDLDNGRRRATDGEAHAALENARDLLSREVHRVSD